MQILKVISPRQSIQEVLPSPNSILLSARQANNSGEKMLGQRIETLFRKPEDQDGGLMPQNTILPGLDFRLLLY